MSSLLIQQYMNHLADLLKVSGTKRESVIREAFKDLLKAWARSHDLIFVAEYEITTPAKERRYVDGALLHGLRVPLGYWEAKDTADDLNAEIKKKLKRGYPSDNIIFEDSNQAVLIQDDAEVMRCKLNQVPECKRLLELFFGYERPEIEQFRKAVDQFKEDLPAVLVALREMIEAAYRDVSGFRKAAEKFLTHAQQTINPNVSAADVREMLIQHILTEEIFSKVFGDDDFHRQNNIAKELYALEGEFFVGGLKKKTLKALDPYYAAIRSAAAQISSHSEKQTFLKAIYENFYRVYNKKAADRLGVVYTPNEIVRFMIEGADWLCEEHFNKSLIDRDIEILDPATGTGTFICELLEHFRGQVPKLSRKYAIEAHANEVAILPYYVANLNIEATYAAITGDYAEFPNLCFVDTLDNVAALAKHEGHMDDLLGSLSDENVERIKRQNARKISVIIGNPPYNANQMSENENNKNRSYLEVDRRIRESYVKASTAQKTKMYDMYARFFRWATDRLPENGILAFITNRSFIDSKTYDGFRKSVMKDFNEIRVLDLGGDVRSNPKLSGTRHNVFGIQTGVAISFMVRKSGIRECKVLYARRPEFEDAEGKLAFLANTSLSKIDFDRLRLSKDGWWKTDAEEATGTAPFLVSRETKAAKSSTHETALFKAFSLGASTNRDEWLVDSSRAQLELKARYLLGEIKKVKDTFPDSIKWSETLKRRVRSGWKERFQKSRIRPYLYRPFHKTFLYESDQLIDRPSELSQLFPDFGAETRSSRSNRTIVFTGPTSQKPFMVMACELPFDLHLVGAAAGAIGVPEFVFDSQGAAVSNVTKNGLAYFQKHVKASGQSVTPRSIFHYVYALLHDPTYREQNLLVLKQSFPTIPVHSNFSEWSAWGEMLMSLHLGYERVKPWPLKRNDAGGSTRRSKSAGRKDSPEPILRAYPERGEIVVDSATTLTAIPEEAWKYRLGNRSAIEWILDQHKNKRGSDETISRRFSANDFGERKESVIDLVGRVTRVSIETVEILEAMRVRAG